MWLLKRPDPIPIKKISYKEDRVPNQLKCRVCFLILDKPVKCGNEICLRLLCQRCALKQQLCPYECSRYAFQQIQMSIIDVYYFQCHIIICSICNRSVDFLLFRKHARLCQIQYQRWKRQEEQSLLPISEYCNQCGKQCFSLQKCKYCHFYICHNCNNKTYNCINLQCNFNQYYNDEDSIQNQLKKNYMCEQCQVSDFQENRELHLYECNELFIQCDVCLINCRRNFYKQHIESCTKEFIHNYNNLQEINQQTQFLQNFRLTQLKQEFIQANDRTNILIQLPGMDSEQI